MRAPQLGQQPNLPERAGRGPERIGDAVRDEDDCVLWFQLDARLGVDLLGHDPQRRSRRRDHLLRVAARALDEWPEVAGAGDRDGAGKRIDLRANCRHEQVRVVGRDDRVVEDGEHRPGLLAAREVLSQQPAQARYRNGCGRAVAADVGDEHKDVTFAMLDDLEEVAAMAEGPVLPGSYAELTPGR